jgi:hypothetical protein
MPPTAVPSPRQGRGKKEKGGYFEMKLMTKELEGKLAKCPLGSQDDLGIEAKVIVKFFNPVGTGTWLITEGEKLEDGDWLLYGYCHIFEWEWGSVLLSELQSAKIPPFGLGIERDLYSSGTVGELINQ